MKVYGYPTSYSCCKVYWALKELGLPFESVFVDVVGGEQKKPFITGLNPNQGIPILDDEGFVLYESGAILMYLEGAHGKGRLLPVAERALAMQWLLWENGHIGPAMVKPWLMKFGESLGAPFDPDAHAALIAATRRPLGILNDHLAGRRFVTGTAFSLADIAIGEAIHMHTFGQVPLSDYPEVRRWFEGIAERPAFQQTRER
jgi:glutathione S-transferase